MWNAANGKPPWVLWQSEAEVRNPPRWDLAVSWAGLELQAGWERRVALAPPPLGRNDAMAIELGRLDPRGRFFALTYSIVDRNPGQPSPQERRSPPYTSVWSAGTGRLLIHSSSDAEGPTFDATGEWMAIANPPNGTIDLYRTADFSLARRVKLGGLPRSAPDQLPPYFQVAPTGDRIAFVHQGVLYLWDMVEDRAVTMVDKPGHFGPVYSVAQHRGARLTASGGSEGVILLWDRQTGRCLRTLVGHAAAVVELAFDPDGRHLASASSDGTIVLWEVGGRATWTGRAADSPVVGNGLIFSPTGKTLFVGTSKGRLMRFDVASGQVEREADSDRAGLSAVSLSPSGRRIASASPRGRVRIWADDLSPTPVDWEAGPIVNSLAFAGSDDVLWTGGRALELREATTGRVLLVHEPPRAPVRLLKFDAGTGDLYFTDMSTAVHALNLAEFNGVLRDLALDVPGLSAGTRPHSASLSATISGIQRRGEGVNLRDEAGRQPGQAAGTAGVPRAWSDLRLRSIDMHLQ
jgi:WD40 repeat protein